MVATPCPLDEPLVMTQQRREMRQTHKADSRFCSCGRDVSEGENSVGGKTQCQKKKAVWRSRPLICEHSSTFACRIITEATARQFIYSGTVIMSFYI